MAPSVVRLQTFNMQQKFFMRHHNSEGEINEFNLPGPAKDFDWRIHFLRLEEGFRLVSFEAVQPADHFLRHQNYRLVLSENDGTPLFERDRTFRVTNPLFGDPAEGWISYQAYEPQFRNRFIAHKDFHLYIRDMNEPFMQAGEDGKVGDATWKVVAP
ncbi:AbfB domain-containing protein [Streptomyces sp. Tue6028]|uniref:AbfB domain-containing protein n=1 Tax=Streptomyces sp. Tue6028 TaxID=2036037 RepID=UPI003D720325